VQTRRFPLNARPKPSSRSSMAVLALEAVAQIAHTVVGRLHTHVLLLDDMAHVRRQLVVLKCVAILSDGSIFATLAFHEDSVLVAAGYRGFQIHPTAAERSSEAAARLHFFAKAKNEALQLAGKLLALDREFTEELLEIDALHVFRGRAETFLPVFAGL
jgi:hypothetical protein